MEVKPFTATFSQVVFGGEGEIILCGFLDDASVASLNHFRNSLICEPDEQNPPFFSIRPKTDPPKHRLAFHVTIGNLKGDFTFDRLKKLQQYDWISTGFNACIKSFSLVHYSRKRCIPLVGEAVKFELGNSIPITEDEIRERLCIT